MTEEMKSGQDFFATWRQWQENWLKQWIEASQKQADEWARLWSFPLAGGKDAYGTWVSSIKEMIENMLQGQSLPLGPEVFSKTLVASQTYLKLLEFWGRVSGSVAPSISGKPDPEKLKEVFDQWIKEYQTMMTTLWGLPPDSDRIEMFKTGMQMLRNGIESVWKFWAPVIENMDHVPEAMERAAKGDQKGLIEIQGLLRKSYQESLGRLLNLPTMGFSRETIERVNRSIDAFLEFVVVLNEYYSMFYQTGTRAAEKVYSRLGEFSEQDWNSPDGFRKFYRLWWTINEDTYHELFMSPEFTAMLKQVLDRGLLFRKWLDSLTDKILEMTNIPTKKDMDEIYQALYELKKEVRWQRRAIKKLESSGQKSKED
jgi:class III poly(R)-hydroxyalkanoic acid synthase PhaE subunit